MRLVPMDALVASWILQSALGFVFLISLWGLVAAFRRRAVSALAIGWSFYLLMMLASLASAVIERRNGSSSALALAGIAEGAALICMLVVLQPVAGFMAGKRSDVVPSRSMIAGAVALIVVLSVAGGVTGRSLIVPGEGPLAYAYPAAFAWLAISAWRVRQDRKSVV